MWKSLKGSKKKTEKNEVSRNTEKSSKTSKKTKAANAKVIIKYDVGLNNNLYIRGSGAGLSWEKGQLMKNMGPDEWIWEPAVDFDNCEFKVLINDNWYEVGENHHLSYEGSVQYTPHFS